MTVLIAVAALAFLALALMALLDMAREERETKYRDELARLEREYPRAGANQP